MSTGFSFGTGTLGSTTVAPGGTGAGGGFSFGTGHLGGFGTGLFGTKPTTGFTLGGTNTGIVIGVRPKKWNSSNYNYRINSGDSKALKDENLPPVICQDVENLQKFVKEQKQVQEEISRMSSKAMLEVQEDIKTLSLAASGLQRNTPSIDKLKTETAQVLAGTFPGVRHNSAEGKSFVLLIRCPGASHRRLALERRKTDKAQTEIENENGTTVIDLPGTLSLETDCSGTGISPAECSLISASLPPWPEEPGLDNPALEENTATDTMQQPVSFPEGKITTIEIHRSDPYIQLGIRIVGGGLAPLNNRYIVIQEVCRDGVIAKDGRLLAGDPILQASGDRVDLTIARPGKSQPGNPVQDTGAQGSSQQHAQPLYHNRPSSHKMRPRVCMFSFICPQGILVTNW
ncbi:uncharacterized protein LOC131813645 [Mustela lutreola]|uniref:uncharacterized protein LOC131813645 n=1 Tax=Mustela lutreola TaxID=9666 RepID=UPI0027978487|nr:uncharacterized protein LOC131813645 [Mustela lutreola]